MELPYTRSVENTDIPFERLVSEILKKEKFSQFEVEQFCDKENEYDRFYDVYKIITDGGIYVLKKSDGSEIKIYTELLRGKGFMAPEYYGYAEYDGIKWMLMEFVSGIDLREFTEEMAYAAAESIAPVMNAYWQEGEQEFTEHKLDDRFERYWKRINKRAECLKNDKLIADGYDVFLHRQLSCPRTLSNGDFLQFNAIFHDGIITIIDWAFGGIMPYSLDIARLITHGTENRITFPFYMNDEYRRIYVEEVYERLAHKPNREQYLFDIKLSMLNECIEFIEMELNDPSLERDAGWEYYYDKAKEISREILEIKKRNPENIKF